jgi:hypothetical protein
MEEQNQLGGWGAELAAAVAAAAAAAYPAVSIEQPHGLQPKPGCAPAVHGPQLGLHSLACLQQAQQPQLQRCKKLQHPRQDCDSSRLDECVGEPSFPSSQQAEHSLSAPLAGEILSMAWEGGGAVGQQWKYHEGPHTRTHTQILLP